MVVREIIQIGSPVLKAANQKITDFNSPKLKHLVADLTDSMRSAGLIGMAAPQIGENHQVFVTEPRETEIRSKDQTDELRVYINPQIVKQSAEKVIIYEGCGSVVHGELFGPVERPKTIIIEAFDPSGHKFRFTADGILGRVIQHEYDHMSGIEFLEKITDYRKVVNLQYYLEQIKDDPKYIQASIITIKKFEMLK